MGKLTAGYVNWVAQNEEVIKNAVTYFLDVDVKPKVLKALADVANAIVAYVEGGNFGIPIWTGNLQDATGVGIYADGKVEKFMPIKIARKKQSMGTALGGRSYIDGHEFLIRSIEEGATKFTDGIWIVLYSAVPYASHINFEGSKWGRGVGYFQTAETAFKQQVFQALTGLSQGDPSIGSFFTFK